MSKRAEHRWKLIVRQARKMVLAPVMQAEVEATREALVLA